MKGNFSRQTFNPPKHYSGVLLQQGRVQLDADWNEQQAITQRRIETETMDVVGRCGAPMNAPGFEITLKKDNTLSIGRGRYYVDGILCENDVDVDYVQQPYLLDVPEVVSQLKAEKTFVGLAYLDVWQRHITALDDAHIREVALGGPDTATRIQTIWQVKTLPVQLQGSSQQRLKALLDQLDALQGKQAADDKSEPGTSAKAQQGKGKSPTRGKSTIEEEINKAYDEIRQLFGEITCGSQIDTWDALTSPSARTLKARTQQPPETDDPCLIPPSAGYRRLENQLYRVEVHKKGALGSATFKWSRENGSVVTAIEQFNGSEITVHDVGADEVLGFANGQWVEVVDDGKDLSGEPGQLLQIDEVNPATRVITLRPAPAAIDPKRYPKLRRWDQNGAAGGDGILVTSDWLPLEDGIEVQFSKGTYSTGDYWLIPARTAIGDIEWPPYDTSDPSYPAPQPPLGIQHHYCRLALLHLDPVNNTLSVQDCRSIFVSLPAVNQALHVVSINWSNDDTFPVNRLRKEGLRIELDDEPDPEVDMGPAVIVSLEVPLSLLYSWDVNAPELKNRSLFREIIDEPHISLLMYGSVVAESKTVHWSLSQDAGKKQGQDIFDLLPLANQQKGAPGQNRFRMHVTLKGHAIWSQNVDGIIYLDGQAFGAPGKASTQGEGPITSLNFPSGAEMRASDFESWFYLGPPEAELDSLALKSAQVNIGDSSEGTVTLDGPAPSGGAVINLTSDNTVVAVVPARVTVPEQQHTATFPVTTLPDKSNTTHVDVTITASRNTITRTSTLRIMGTPG